MSQDNCTVVEKVKELIQIYELGTKSRDRDKVYQRAYCYSILREQGWHLTKISKLFNRTHATVINALKTHDNYYKKDKIYDKIVEEYEQIFYPVVKIEVEIPQDSIFEDIMNCHNSTSLKMIKDKIMAGGYGSVNL